MFSFGASHHSFFVFQAADPGRGRAAPQGARLQLFRLPQHEAQFIRRLMNYLESLSYGLFNSEMIKKLS